MAQKAKHAIVSIALAGAIAIGPQAGQIALADSNDSSSNSSDLPKQIQLVSDEQRVGAGGVIHYHIIYHNNGKKAHPNVVLQVKVPEGLDVDDGDEDQGIWDASARTLTWSLNDVDVDKALIFHFHLKVKETLAAGSQYAVSCMLTEDGQISTVTPTLTVTTGTEIDQPFFKGYPDGNFHPTAFISRAEAAAVVARILNLTNSSPQKQYSDVPQSYWGYNYIEEVTNAGYMRGYQDGTFHPDNPLSRAELVTLLLNIRGIQAVPLEGFEDSKGHWAKDDIGTAKALKYVDGVESYRFDPDGPTERQAAAKLFDIALFRGPLMDGKIPVVQHFPDVPPSIWSFHWVEEGSVVAHESEHRNGYEYLLQYLPDQTRLN